MTQLLCSRGSHHQWPRGHTVIVEKLTFRAFDASQTPRREQGATFTIQGEEQVDWEPCIEAPKGISHGQHILGIVTLRGLRRDLIKRCCMWLDHKLIIHRPLQQRGVRCHRPSSFIGSPAVFIPLKLAAKVELIYGVGHCPTARCTRFALESEDIGAEKVNAIGCADAKQRRSRLCAIPATPDLLRERPGSQTDSPGFLAFEALHLEEELDVDAAFSGMQTGACLLEASYVCKAFSYEARSAVGSVAFCVPSGPETLQVICTSPSRYGR